MFFQSVILFSFLFLFSACSLINSFSYFIPFHFFPFADVTPAPLDTTATQSDFLSARHAQLDSKEQGVGALKTLLRVFSVVRVSLQALSQVKLRAKTVPLDFIFQ